MLTWISYQRGPVLREQGGEEADLHNHVPDNIFRMAERPGPLRDALEARAAASKYSVQTIFSRLLAHCFIR